MKGILRGIKALVISFVSSNRNKMTNNVKKTNSFEGVISWPSRPLENRLSNGKKRNTRMSR